MSEKEKTRYSDSELQEFKDLIKSKIDGARHELAKLQDYLSNANANGTEDTIGSYKTLDDGSATHSKENVSQLASRQRKFIENLEVALIRIENKTYGVCKVTGKLIPMERLRAVPHTTMSIEAKLKQYR